MINLDFTDARFSHFSWKLKLRKFLDNEEGMEKIEAVSHQHCELGKWLYSEGMDKYGDLPDMKQLEQVHIEMHDSVRKVIDLKNTGKLKEAEDEYRHTRFLSEKVLRLMEYVEIRLTTIKR